MAIPHQKLPAYAALKTACSTCSLRELCLPIGLSENDLGRLDGLINMRKKVKAGQHIFRASDTFHALRAVRSGFFKTYEINEEGQEQVSGFHMPGELMGFDAISTDKHMCNAVALEDSEVCEIPFGRLEELTREIPVLQHQVFKLFSREVASDHRLLMVLGTMSAEQRLAMFLVNLSERLALRGLSPTQFHLSMSREDIGNYLGLTLETVSRTFSKLQKDGAVSIDRRNVVITDLKKLHAIAGR